MNSFLPGELLNTLSGAGASNEARLRLLEKRLVGQDVLDDRLRRYGNQPSPSAAGLAQFPATALGGEEPCTGSGDQNSFNGDLVQPALQPGSHAPRQPLRFGQQSGDQPTLAAANKGQGAQKRKRTSSPIEQRPLGQGPGEFGFQDRDGAQRMPLMQVQQPQAAAASTPVAAQLPSGAGGSTRKTGGRSASKAAARVVEGGGGTSGAGPSTKVPGSGQTTLNAYYPVVDGSSRDSELSHGLTGGQQQQQQQQYKSGASSPFMRGGQMKTQPGSDAGARQRLGPEGRLSGTSLGAQSALTPSRSRAMAAGDMEQSLRPMLSGQLLAIPEAGIMQEPDNQAHVQQLAAQAAQLSQQLAAREQQLAEAQQQLRQVASSADKRASDLQAETAAALSRAQNLADELNRVQQAAEEKEAKIKTELTKVMTSSARDKHELTKLQLATAAVRLGNVGVQRNGLALQEVWEDGQAAQSLASRQAALAAQRAEVEAARKALRKKLAPPPSHARAAAAAASAAANGGGGGGGGGDGGPSTSGAGGPEGGYMDGLEFVTMDEIYKMRLATLKREEDVLKEEAERLSVEKARHVRTIKRIRDEEGSRFGCGRTVLMNRFVLLSMLGKGGFSEVFKAYDLRDLKVVAVKVHQLNPGWSETRKQSYVKHAIREVEIQKVVSHTHVVALHDVLEVDAHCFATILEYCEGGDLDSLLRDHTLLPEKEARSIISQVMAGLNYLNQPGRRIIHYDLKPANILFDGLGAAKITDFGLSKIVEDGATQGMELTSQGAGTYWYLPPECFETNGPHAPRITNKVDVWSVGVIFFQMLFGRRPYGEGLSQEQIMRDRVVLGAREVDFPAKPAVSSEAKEFIRKCLALRADSRWDVATAAADPYLSGNRKAT